MLAENMKAQRKLREMRPERIKCVIVFLKVLVRGNMHKVAGQTWMMELCYTRVSGFPQQHCLSHTKALQRGQKSWQSIAKSFKGTVEVDVASISAAGCCSQPMGGNLYCNTKERFQMRDAPKQGDPFCCSVSSKV
jgi:hypothetical protein